MRSRRYREPCRQVIVAGQSGPTISVTGNWEMDVCVRRRPE